MSIIQKLLGGPGYFMEASKATMENLTSTDPKPAKAKKEEAKSAPEPKVESAPAAQPVPEDVTQAVPASVAAPESVTSVAATDSGTMTEPASTDAAPKKSRKKSRKKSTAAVADPAPATTAAVAVVGDVQALVTAAIAQDSAERVQEAEAASEGTFATDYLLVPTMSGRRRPGPSLAGFMDMAGTMRR